MAWPRPGGRVFHTTLSFPVYQGGGPRSVSEGWWRGRAAARGARLRRPIGRYAASSPLAGKKGLGAPKHIAGSKKTPGAVFESAQLAGMASRRARRTAVNVRVVGSRRADCGCARGMIAKRGPIAGPIYTAFLVDLALARGLGAIIDSILCHGFAPKKLTPERLLGLRLVARDQRHERQVINFARAGGHSHYRCGAPGDGRLKLILPPQFEYSLRQRPKTEPGAAWLRRS